MPITAEDELEILRVLARLAQACDDRDEAGYRACLFETVQGEDPDAPPVPAPAYASAAIARVAKTEWTHHQLSNAVVVQYPDRDRASVSIDAIADMTFRDGRQVRHRQTIGGRYAIGLVRTHAGWRIDRRAFHQRYVECRISN